VLITRREEAMDKKLKGESQVKFIMSEILQVERK